MNQPYVIMLVDLGHDPNDWFSEPIHRGQIGVWDHYLQFGRFNFMYDRAVYTAKLDELRQNGRTDRGVFIVRPAEWKGDAEPSRQIPGPDGRPALWIIEQEM